MLNNTNQEACLSTDEAAAILKIRPQTLRAAVCRQGHYCNVVPAKAANRFLYWNTADILRIVEGGA